ncbi:MAG: hypothetical protein K2X48_16575 [Chitinophagaceae bacterium]|nr:hypothetical protein [Chitinophagaceae bacterium]
MEKKKTSLASKYVIDDCVLKAFKSEQKCDYLFLVFNGALKDGYFIELKGGDVPKAINQLLNSVQKLRANVSGSLFGRIISSKFHNTLETINSNEYRQLRKLLSGNLKIKNIKFKDSISL